MALSELDTKEIKPLLDLLRTSTRRGWSRGEHDDSVRPDAAPVMVRQKNYRQLTGEEKLSIVQLYEEGVSVNDIANTHRVTRQTVHRVCRDAGVQKRIRGLNMAQLAEAIHRYQAGQSLATIGQVFGVSPSTIRECLLKANVSLRPRNGWRQL